MVASTRWVTVGVIGTLLVCGWPAIAAAQQQQATAPEAHQRQRVPRTGRAYRLSLDVTREELFQAYRYAPLETEAMLFERLERESKIESIRAVLRSIHTRLLGAKRLIRLPGAFQLESALRHLGDHVEASPQGAALQRARNAQLALEYSLRVLDHARQQAAAGTALTPAQWFRLQRLVRVAATYLGPPGKERGLGTLGFLDMARQELAEARVQFETAVGNIADNDPRRARLEAALQQMTALMDDFDQLRNDVSVAVQKLDTLRAEVFTSCPPDAAAQTISQLFEQAFQQRDMLAELLDQIRQIEERIGALAGQIEALQLAIDEGTAYGPEERRIWQLLADMEQVVDQSFLLLWDAEQVLRGLAPEEEPRTCRVCGMPHGKVVRLPGAVESCVQAQRRVAATLELLEKMRTRAEELITAVRQAKRAAPTDSDRERLDLVLTRLAPGSDGVQQGLVQEVNVAVTRATEFARQRFDTYPVVRVWPDLRPAKPRQWPQMTASYVAPINWHLPVYFDDINAERFGNHVGIVQPFASAAKFYGDIVLLPYRAWLTPPWQPLSTAGLPRPGDEVAPVLYVPPFDWTAAAAAVGWWALWLSIVP